MSEFIPFDTTDDMLRARRVLRDGVPSSMRPSLVGWIANRVVNDHRMARMELLRAAENNCDLDLGLGTITHAVLGEAAVQRIAALPDRDLLMVTHYLLSQINPRKVHNPEFYVTPLRQVLTEGRSRWTVGTKVDGIYGLVARVPEGVQQAAEALMDADDVPGRLLARAWSAVHDLDPADSAAYSFAVRAVEAAALPVLGLTKDTATIGDVVRAIERKDATWRLPFKREHTEYPSREVLLAMLKSLYRGHRDRHGSEAYSDVTHEEALAAVLMAVTLVGLFAGSLVQKRDPADFS